MSLSRSLLGFDSTISTVWSKLCFCPVVGLVEIPGSGCCVVTGVGALMTVGFRVGKYKVRSRASKDPGQPPLPRGEA